jgi:hypothetical protein
VTWEAFGGVNHTPNERLAPILNELLGKAQARGAASSENDRANFILQPGRIAAGRAESTASGEPVFVAA